MAQVRELVPLPPVAFHFLKLLKKEVEVTGRAIICCVVTVFGLSPALVGGYFGVRSHLVHPLWLATFFLCSGFLIYNETYIHITSRPGVKWVYFKIYMAAISIGLVTFFIMSFIPHVLTAPWPHVVWLFAIPTLVHYWVAMLIMAMSGNTHVDEDWTLKRLTLTRVLILNVFTVLLLCMLFGVVVGAVFVMHMYSGDTISLEELVLTGLAYPCLRGLLKSLLFWMSCKTNQAHRDKVLDSIVVGSGSSAKVKVSQVLPTVTESSESFQRVQSGIAWLDARIEEKMTVCSALAMSILFTTPGLSAITFTRSWLTFSISLIINAIQEWFVDFFVLQTSLRCNMSTETIRTTLLDMVCLCWGPRSPNGFKGEENSWDYEKYKKELSMQEFRLSAHDYSEKMVCILAPFAGLVTLQTVIAYADDVSADMIRERVPEFEVLAARCVCNLVAEIVVDVWKNFAFWKMYGVNACVYLDSVRLTQDVLPMASSFLLACGCLLAGAALYFIEAAALLR